MPHLADIPGLAQLQSLTLGDPRVTIAILDGRADLERACFQGANLSQVLPFWQETVDIEPQDLEMYLAIANQPTDATTQKQQLETAFPDQTRLNRIHLACHATHIASILLGQPGSPVAGIAPHCTGINIPLDLSGIDGELISALTLSRAFNLAQVKGANLIHCAACQPTQSGVPDELLQQAIRQSQDQNRLIVAPAGNDYGECWCIPATLPGVLAVGATQENGHPFPFSNWGGTYQSQGILAPGENIWGAQPGTDAPIRHQGTSCAAPIVTGVAALLMSLQLQNDRPLDPEAVQAAILNSVLPCDPVDDLQPGQCLRGKLNISGAWSLLFESPAVTISFANAAASPTEHHPPETATVATTPSHEPPTLTDLRQFYDDIANTLGEQGRTYEACFLRFLDPTVSKDRATNLFVAAQAGIKPGDYILDAACGAGGPSIDIAQYFPTVSIEGINLSEAQVDVAQRLVREADLEDRIRIQVGDYHALPYGDDLFDVVMCLEASGYAIDLAKMLAEFYRVLRPGGTLYLKEWLRAEHPLTPEEQQALTHQEQLALYQTARASVMQVRLHQAGFEEITIRDLSAVLAPDSGWDAPICCGDIKAKRPGLTLSAVVPPPSSAPLSESAPPTSAIQTEGPSAVPALVPSGGDPPFVYALGTLGYDFGSEARRDSFKQLMPQVIVEDQSRVSADPHDARQMVSYLGDHLSESLSLIWTLNLELTPVYAIEPTGPFAREVYARLQQLLAGEIAPPGSADFIDRISIPGRLSRRNVRLFSGQIVPVIEVQHLRGLYGWHTNALARAASSAILATDSAVDPTVVETALAGFMNRVYYDLRNLGQTARDRALNFAVTNAFQAASTFATAVGQGMQLDSINIEPSPFCRLYSDCWDVKLKFFDPENNDRSRKVYRFTIDVSDSLPVTLGDVRSWSVPE